MKFQLKDTVTATFTGKIDSIASHSGLIHVTGRNVQGWLKPEDLKLVERKIEIGQKWIPESNVKHMIALVVAVDEYNVYYRRLDTDEGHSSRIENFTKAYPYPAEGC